MTPGRAALGAALLSFLLAGTARAEVRAGAARVDFTPEKGVPLSGYSARRRPLPRFGDGPARLLEPSTGVRDPLHARALFLADEKTKVCIVSIDAIATSREVVEATWKKARAGGSTVALEDLMVCASHTHSGPGAITRLDLWAIFACDLFHAPTFEELSGRVARAIVEAERTAAPARIGVAAGTIEGVTRNRRADVSPDLEPGSVDREAIVVRVDREDGTRVATLWNFAIHGTALGHENRDFSGDVMGEANARLEKEGGVALFVNGAEGDVAPARSGEDGLREVGARLAEGVLAIRERAPVHATMTLGSSSAEVDLGSPRVSLTAKALAENTVGRVPALRSFVKRAFDGRRASSGRTEVPLPASWVERSFRFQSIRIGSACLVSIPGEALHEVGLEVKRRGKALGFEHVLPCGLANGHAGYVATEREFGHGGYEALLTFFGPGTAARLEDACEERLRALAPR